MFEAYLICFFFFLFCSLTLLRLFRQNMCFIFWDKVVWLYNSYCNVRQKQFCYLVNGNQRQLYQIKELLLLFYFFIYSWEIDIDFAAMFIPIKLRLCTRVSQGIFLILTQINKIHFPSFQGVFYDIMSVKNLNTPFIIVIIVVICFFSTVSFTPPLSIDLNFGPFPCSNGWLLDMLFFHQP